MPSILDRIIETKKREVDELRASIRQRDWDVAIRSAPPARDFLAALSGYNEIRLIAEVKKASPSKGMIREDFDPVAIAKQYQSAGAAALSVLTDVDYFQGALEYLIAIRKTVHLPLLRKDFIIDEIQIDQARIAGADAVLLIAECLSPIRLDALYKHIRSLGMHCLMELYDPANLPQVLDSGCPIIGVNNRDLHTFEVDLNHTIRLRKQIPADRCMVGESGIFSHSDAQLLFESGVQAILVGESLMRQSDIEYAVRNLLGKES
jgi:indole-3-glycerol phosphate synthase